MKKIQLPLEITEEAIEIYQQAYDNREEDSIAIKKIQDMLEERGLPCSDRTVYRMIQEWKRTGVVKSIIESFDIDLGSPYRRTELILSMLEDELKKSIQANENVMRKIRIADAMHKYIETEIKIEVLRSKKTTSINSNEDSGARIVGVVNDL